MEEVINISLTNEELDCIIGWGEQFDLEYGNSVQGEELLNKLKLIYER